MVNVYNSIRSDHGNPVRSRTKLFITKTDEAGNILDHLYGYAIVPEDSGTMFIVDEYVVEQIHKLQMVEGQLQVKEGETIEEPKKTKKELERERLKAQLAALDAEPETVNINTASLDTLTTLDGIGETKARDIIDYREAHGEFTATEDLMEVPGIGEALYNEIQGQITV